MNAVAASRRPSPRPVAGMAASRRVGWVWAVCCWWVLLCAPLGTSAQDLLPVPPLTARVLDQTATLEPGALANIEAKLADFERTQGTQVVVVMVATTLPEDIADFTQRLGDAWKIGRPGVGDGLLLVVAKNDRRFRIATSKALEGVIPDVLAKRILDDAVKPAFRQGDFAGGILAGLDQLMAHIGGEGLPPPATHASTAGNDVDWADALIILVFAVPLMSSVLRGLLGNKLGLVAGGAGAAVLAWAITGVWWLALGAGVLAMVVGLFSSALPSPSVRRGRRGRQSSDWPGGWGGGSSSGGGWGDGGGFSSGGGGDFGGGGASGDW